MPENIIGGGRYTSIVSPRNQMFARGLCAVICSQLIRRERSVCRCSEPICSGVQKVLFCPSEGIHCLLRYNKGLVTSSTFATTRTKVGPREP
jgi:hypothetical protein